LIPQLVRKLSYVPAVRKLVIAVGLRSTAQKVYHQHYAPAGGIFDLSYGGSQAKFSTPSIKELRALEIFSSGGDKEFRQLVSMIHKDEVFFDIGAQYGVYALLVSNACGPAARVVAFEPFPAGFALLQKNTELNHAANVQCLNVALSDSDGEVGMCSADGSGEFCPRIGGAGATSCSVMAVRADRLIAEGAVPFPNVIKLDVEGHEFAVLRGMSEALGDPRCHSIYCEIHDSLLPPGDSPAGLIAFLQSKGFTAITDEPGPNHYLFAEKA
jgi:FkbM family methyltransferase